MPQPSCRDRVEQALARIADPKGEGTRVCLTVYRDSARAAAAAADARAARGRSLGPLDGAIVSIKDLFDVAGEPTRAGSKILAEEAAPAAADAVILQRLRQAGAVIVAKTNMTEFAFSGIGANTATSIERAAPPSVFAVSCLRPGDTELKSRKNGFPRRCAFTDSAASPLDAAVTAEMTSSACRTASAAETAQCTPLASAARRNLLPAPCGKRISQAVITAALAS